MDIETSIKSTPRASLLAHFIVNVHVNVNSVWCVTLINYHILHSPNLRPIWANNDWLPFACAHTHEQAQYMFIHDTFSEIITCGDTEITATHLRAKVNHLAKFIHGKGITGFAHQFKVHANECAVNSFVTICGNVIGIGCAHLEILFVFTCWKAPPMIYVW